MKIKILALFFLIIGYSSIAQDYIIFGAKAKYFLSQDEQITKIDSNVLAEYTPLNPDLVHQVPLNKFVIAKEYKLFIGLAIFDLPTSIVDFYKNNSDFEILKFETQINKRITYYKMLTSYDGFFDYKIIFLSKKTKYTAVFNFISSNYKILETYYNDPNFIIKKIKK